METKNIWTPETEEQLRKLWADPAMTGQAIAKQMKTTRSAILGKVRRMGLSYRDEAKMKEKKPEQILPDIRKRRAKNPRPIGEPTDKMKEDKKETVRERIKAREQTVTLDPTKFKKIVDLHITKECHYPVTDDLKFCGRPTTGKTVYCQGHENLCISGVGRI